MPTSSPVAGLKDSSAGFGERRFAVDFEPFERERGPPPSPLLPPLLDFRLVRVLREPLASIAASSRRLRSSGGDSTEERK